MRLPQFDYIEPKTLKQAISALAADPARSVLLAGGTDLLVNMKQRLVTPTRIINLKRISKLAFVSTGRSGLRIGALATLDDIAASPAVQKAYPALSLAAGAAGAYAHQVMGTVGGNLCQGNRCRFYNQSASWRDARTPCYKAGGNTCWVVNKPKECHSTYSGDLAPVLIALDAKVSLLGPKRTRSVAVKDLYTQDGHAPLALRRGEILQEVVVPPPSGHTVYLKVRLRESIDFPIISLAVSIAKARNGAVSKARIVFSAVGSGPVQAPDAEAALKGSLLDDGVVDRVCRRVSREITPWRTSQTTPGYKRRMAGNLLKQALDTLRNGAI